MRLMNNQAAFFDKNKFSPLNCPVGVFTQTTFAIELILIKK